MGNFAFDLPTCQLIAAEYAAGAGATTLARKYGRGQDAIYGAVKRCGGTRRTTQQAGAARRKDYTDQKVGEWKVIRFERDPKTGRSGWLSQCVCGNRQIVPAAHFERGDKRCYECSQNGGRTRGLSAAERRQRFGRVRYEVNEGAFEGEVTPEMAYFGGLLITDGYQMSAKYSHRPNGNRRGVGISLETGDADIIEEFRRFLDSTHPIGSYKGTTRQGNPHSYVKFDICSTRLADSLLRFGVTPTKTYTASAPDFLLNNRDWWRGAADGDGGVTFSDRGHPVLTFCGTRMLVSQFADFARTVTDSRTELKPNKSIWQYHLTGNSAIDVIRVLYDGATVSMRRKREAAAVAIQTHVRVMRNTEKYPHNPSDFTREELLAAHGRLGTWAKVAKEFGFLLETLFSSEIVKGAFPTRLAGVTAEQLRADYLELGSARRVAKKHGTSHACVVAKMRSVYPDLHITRHPLRRTAADHIA